MKNKLLILLSGLAGAIAALVLITAIRANGQDTLNATWLQRTNAVPVSGLLQPLRWCGGDSVQFDLYVRNQAGSPIVLNQANVAFRWDAVRRLRDNDPVYITKTGAVISATNGHVRFLLSPAEGNLPAGNWFSMVRAFQSNGGVTQYAGTLHRSALYVEWNPSVSVPWAEAVTNTFDCSAVTFLNPELAPWWTSSSWGTAVTELLPGDGMVVSTSGQSRTVISAFGTSIGTNDMEPGAHGLYLNQAEADTNALAVLAGHTNDGTIHFTYSNWITAAEVFLSELDSNALAAVAAHSNDATIHFTYSNWITAAEVYLSETDSNALAALAGHTNDGTVHFTYSNWVTGAQVPANETDSNALAAIAAHSNDATIHFVYSNWITAGQVYTNEQDTNALAQLGTHATNSTLHMAYSNWVTGLQVPANEADSNALAALSGHMGSNTIHFTYSNWITAGQVQANEGDTNALAALGAHSGDATIHFTYSNWITAGEVPANETDTNALTVLSQHTNDGAVHFAYSNWVSAADVPDAEQDTNALATLAGHTNDAGIHGADSNVVHRTGDEGIAGQKTFSNAIWFADGGWAGPLSLGFPFVPLAVYGPTNLMLLPSAGAGTYITGDVIPFRLWDTNWPDLGVETARWEWVRAENLDLGGAVVLGGGTNVFSLTVNGVSTLNEDDADWIYVRRDGTSTFGDGVGDAFKAGGSNSIDIGEAMVPFRTNYVTVLSLAGGLVSYTSGRIKLNSTNLLLALDVGSVVQAYDADLTTLAGRNGGILTGLNASALSSGTVPNARLDAQLQEWANISTNGGLDEAQLDVSANASLDLADSAVQPGDDWTNTISGTAAATIESGAAAGATAVQANDTNVTLSGTFSGDGSGLTNLPVSSSVITCLYDHIYAESAPFTDATNTPSVLYTNMNASWGRPLFQTFLAFDDTTAQYVGPQTWQPVSTWNSNVVFSGSHFAAATGTTSYIFSWVQNGGTEQHVTSTTFTVTGLASTNLNTFTWTATLTGADTSQPVHYWLRRNVADSLVGNLYLRLLKIGWVQE